MNVGLFGEIEGIWEEVVVAHFKVLSWHSHGVTKKNRERLAPTVIRMGNSRM
jgi:hypothetical protein